MNELKKALMSVSGPELTAMGRRIVGDNNYSDQHLNVKFAKIRRQYPAYDAICREIQGQTLMEETLIHASGMELMLRILVAIAEERDREPAVQTDGEDAAV
ncbi:MAG: hypothetical protein GY835_08785 [bacterium]|nr:hypothetical protein [bacterium]